MKRLFWATEHDKDWHPTERFQIAPLKLALKAMISESQNKSLLRLIREYQRQGQSLYFKIRIFNSKFSRGKKIELKEPKR